MAISGHTTRYIPDSLAISLILPCSWNNRVEVRGIIRLVFILTLVLALGPANTVGQDLESYILKIGKPEFTVSQPVELGFINVSNGNLHLEIPIGSFPQRGNSPTLTAKFIYDGRICGLTPSRCTS